MAEIKIPVNEMVALYEYADEWSLVLRKCRKAGRWMTIDAMNVAATEMKNDSS